MAPAPLSAARWYAHVDGVAGVYGGVVQVRYTSIFRRRHLSEKQGWLWLGIACVRPVNPWSHQHGRERVARRCT